MTVSNLIWKEPVAAASTANVSGTFVVAPSAVATIGSITQPTSGTVYDGTYTGINLTGGTGSGAVASVVVVSGSVTTVLITNGGSGYVVGDVLDYTDAPGLGSDGTVTVTLTFGGPGDTLTSTSGTGLVIDSYTANVGDRLLLKNQTSGFQNGVYSVTQVAIAGEIATTGTIIQPTSGTLKNGYYEGVALSGGTGTGATANIVVAGNVVTEVIIAPHSGSGYTAGNVLTYNANGDGFGNGGTVTVGTVVTYSDGSNGGGILTTTGFTQPTRDFVTNGTYGLFPLTGGTGTGATANITISNGVVTSVVIVNTGTGYTASDVLAFSGTPNTATQGLGSGGTVEVATITYTPWVLTRTSDVNYSFEVQAMAVFVSGGTVNADTAWVQNNLDVTMDTTSLTYVELVS